MCCTTQESRIQLYINSALCAQCDSAAVGRGERIPLYAVRTAVQLHCCCCTPLFSAFYSSLITRSYFFSRFTALHYSYYKLISLLFENDPFGSANNLLTKTEHFILLHLFLILNALNATSIITLNKRVYSVMSFL